MWKRQHCKAALFSSQRMYHHFETAEGHITEPQRVELHIFELCVERVLTQFCPLLGAEVVVPYFLDRRGLCSAPLAKDTGGVFMENAL